MHGVDDGADSSIALGGPHRAVAVGHFSLNVRRAQQPGRAVVGRPDRLGMGEEDEELSVGSVDIGLQVAGQVAAARRGEYGPESSVEAPALGCQGRGGQGGDALGQGEHGGQPELQTPGHRIVARLDDEGDVAGEMGEAGLVLRLLPEPDWPSIVREMRRPGAT